MADSDGSVVFEVNLNVDKAEKELEKLTDEIKRMDAKLGKADQYDRLTKSITDVTQEVEKARKNLSEISAGDPLGELSDNARRAQSSLSFLERELAKLVSAQKEMEQAGFGPEYRDSDAYLSLVQARADLSAQAGKLVKQIDDAWQRGRVTTLRGKSQEYDAAEILAEVDSFAEKIKDIPDATEVADQHIIDLNRELLELVKRKKELEEDEKGLGYKEYDQVITRISAINRELKEYKKNLTSVAEAELPESAAKNAADEMFQGMADRAAEAMKWVEQYRGQLADLEGRKAQLGLALGAKDEYAQIQSEIDSVTAHLGEMLTELDGLAQSGALGTLAGGAEIAEQRIAELSDELAELQEQQANLGLALGAKAEYEELSEEIERVNQLIEAYQQNLSPERQAENAEAERLQKIADSAEVADQRIIDLRNELAELEERQRDLESAGLGLGVQEYDQNAARIAKISEQLGEYKNKVQGATTMHERLNNVLSRMVGLYKTAGNAASSSLKTVASAVTTVIKKAAALNVFSKLTDGLTKKFSRLGQMIRRVFVFSMITSGLRALRTQIGSYLSTNAEFSAALNRLKGVLLTAFQPIYDAVIPALVTLINVLSSAIAAISQFIAVLFGTTAKQAQKNAKALYGQAAATSAAGSAAEEAAGSLAAFDEINTINTESPGGGGGGGGGGAGAGGPLFDWEYDDTLFESWGEAFDAFLDKILNVGIPKLREGLSRFADWLNEFSKKLYDMFTFPGVKDKVILIGQELASAFNDLVNWINWYQLGQALGAGLNLALLLLVNFLYSFDWMNLGAKLAEFINGLASEIDWYAFGQLLWSGFKIALETLAGFILGLDMPVMADAASKTVMGFFNSMTETLGKISWTEIGLKIAAFLNGIDWIPVLSSVATAIATGLNAAIHTLGTLASTLDWATIGVAIGLALSKLFEDIEWADAGKALSDGLDGMLTLAINFLETTDWSAIGSDIVTFFKNIDWKTLFVDLGTLVGDAIVAQLEVWTSDPAGLIGIGIDIVAGILQGIANALLTIGVWLKENLVDPIVNGVKELFGIHSPSTVMAEIGTYLIEGLFQGISETWGTIVDFFSEKLDALKQTLSDAWDSIKEKASEVWTAIKDGLSEKWENIKSAASEAWGNLKSTISEGWESIKSNTSEKWQNIKSALSDTWGNIKTNAAGSWDNLKNTIGTGWANISSNTSGEWSNIKSALVETWGNVKSAAAESWENLRNTISTGWENIRANTSEKWGNIKSALGDTWDTISTSASTKFTELKDAVVNVWNILSSTTLEIWNGMWNGIKGVINTILGGVEALANGVINALNKMIAAMNSLHFNVPSWVPVIGGNSFGLNIPSIPPISIPRLAQGAVIPPNREFMAVLGDQSSGNNLEAPESLIRQIVREESGGGNTELLQAILEAIKAGHVIMVDRRVLGKTVTAEQNRMTRQSGRSVVLG